VTLKGKSPFDIVEALKAQGFEARPNWKPMHLQPVFQTAPAFLSGVGEDLFAHGLCLPSGRQLSSAWMDEMLNIMERL
ncbi:MAG: aminotransferase DegT, partial [Elusimicrobiales bacterium]|nr:aminotransferase DegT [Elusimicrobiales bacterium]